MQQPLLSTPNQSLHKHLGLAFERPWGSFIWPGPARRGWVAPGNSSSLGNSGLLPILVFQPQLHLLVRSGSSWSWEGECQPPRCVSRSACLSWVTLSKSCPLKRLSLSVRITGAKWLPHLRGPSSTPSPQHCHRKMGQQVSEARRARKANN